MFLTIIIRLITTLTSSVYNIFIFRKSKPTVYIIDPDQAQIILKSTDYTRHKPNHWLIHTLSIVNPFTIPSTSLLNDFKNEVKNTLAHWINDKHYVNLIGTVRNCVEYRRASASQICLSKFVKQVTLDSFLSGILNIRVDEQFLIEIPDLIIYLWKHRDDQEAHHRLQTLISSQSDTFSQSKFWKQIQTILSNHSNTISTIATNEFDEKIHNPLNIIVPGWETMWRVVFYSLLELLRHRELLDELRIQLNNPSVSYKNCQLLERIIKEILRLYPPTKNIYRYNEKTNENVCIQVQAIHRNEKIWGANALEFYPDRFKQKLTDKQKDAYLPFSISCPARHGFAYAFAGAIIAEILKQYPNLIVSNNSSTVLTDTLLDMSRDSYKELLVEIHSQ